MSYQSSRKPSGPAAPVPPATPAQVDLTGSPDPPMDAAAGTAAFAKAVRESVGQRPPKRSHAAANGSIGVPWRRSSPGPAPPLVKTNGKLGDKSNTPAGQLPPPRFATSLPKTPNYMEKLTGYPTVPSWPTPNRPTEPLSNAAAQQPSPYPPVRPIATLSSQRPIAALSSQRPVSTYPAHPSPRAPAEAPLSAPLSLPVRSPTPSVGIQRSANGLSISTTLERPSESSAAQPNLSKPPVQSLRTERPAERPAPSKTRSTHAEYILANVQAGRKFFNYGSSLDANTDRMTPTVTAASRTFTKSTPGGSINSPYLASREAQQRPQQTSLLAPLIPAPVNPSQAFTLRGFAPGTLQTHTLLFSDSPTAGPPGQITIDPLLVDRLRRQHPDPNDVVMKLAKTYGNSDTVAIVRKLERDFSGKDFLARWTQQEDDLLIHVKEELKLKWNDIHLFFPNRTGWQTIQSRYAGKLKNRHSSGPRAPKRRKGNPGVEPQSQSQFESPGSQSSSDEDSAGTGLSTRPSTRARGAHHPGMYTLPPPMPESPSRSPSPPAPDASRIQGEGQAPQGRRLARGGPPNADPANVHAFQAPSCKIPSSLLAPHGHKQTRVSSAVKERDVALLGSAKQGEYPYLRREQRDLLKQSLETTLWSRHTNLAWDGTTMHVDFSEEEMLAIEPEIGPARGIRLVKQSLTRERIEKLMQGADPALIQQLSAKVADHAALRRRSARAIRDFLYDCAWSKSDALPKVETLRVKPVPQARLGVGSSAMTSFLRHRELGSLRSNKSGQWTHRVSAANESFGPARYFNGMSSDTNVLAWAPDGMRFGAGSTAFLDDDSVQYNRPNNLLVGDITSSNLHELAEHMSPRRVQIGINAHRDMQVSQDPWLFQTISGVQFTPDNRHMIATGYDYSSKPGIVSLWDVSETKPICRYLLNHNSQVDSLTINSQGYFAFGLDDAKSTRICRYRRGDGSSLSDDDELKVAKLTSQRTDPDSLIPSSFKWGPEVYGQDRYLLCGFGAKTRDYGGPGHLTMWNLEKLETPVRTYAAQNVFDVEWHASIYGRFAAGCSAGHKVNRGTKSVIRIYDSKMIGDRMAPDREFNCELECPARDMNDVVWSPANDFLISAGCTNGSIYTWDLRKPDEILHRFDHGPTVKPCYDDDSVEDIDTGVRFLAYGPNYKMYTGSSDGIVACWDPLRNTEDAFSHRVADMKSVVMCGAFSPDKTNLLLGGEEGSLSLLSVGLEDRAGELDKGVDRFHLKPATRRKKQLRDMDKFAAVEVLPPEQTGRAAAAALLQNGEITIRRAGNLGKRQAVQGPRYMKRDTADARVLEQRVRSARFQRSLRQHAPVPPCRCDAHIPFAERDEVAAVDTAPMCDEDGAAPEARRRPRWSWLEGAVEPLETLRGWAL